MVPPPAPQATRWGWCHNGFFRSAEVALDADGTFRPDFGGASTWRVAAPALVVIEDVGGTGPTHL